MNLVLGPYGKGAETLLHGEFGAYPSKGSRYALSLTRTALHIQRLVPKPETDQRTVVPLAEVVGCHTLHNRTSADRAAYFSVYAYPLKKRKVAVGSGRGRQRAARTFQVDGADDYEKNQAVAEKWATAIKCLVLGIPISSDTAQPPGWPFTALPGRGWPGILQWSVPHCASATCRGFALWLVPPDEWTGAVSIACDQGTRQLEFTILFLLGRACDCLVLDLVTLFIDSFPKPAQELGGVVSSGAVQDYGQELLSMSICELFGITCDRFRHDVSSGLSVSWQRLSSSYHVQTASELLCGFSDITPSLLPRPPRLLLLLNPFGGRGLALQWCQTHVLPMITEADISFNLIQTERPNHARELVKGINVAEWDGIVAISGDGLLYEVLNGLMERPDWEQAIKMPVGILPSGSGNALAGAINCNAGLEQVLGLELLLNCAMLLCHAAVTPLDLVAVTTASGARCFSCLSVAWGFVSDVDIESEKYRHMGAARFTLGTPCALPPCNHRGRLHLPATRLAINRPPPIHRSITEQSAFRASRPLVPCRPPGSRPLLRLRPTAHSFVGPGELPAGGMGEARVGGPPDELLVPLGQPVPGSWVTVEDNFVLVLAIYQSHLGADLFAAPFARFDDGLIHLCFIKAGISRAALVRLFLAMEKGNHFEQECPHLVHVPVRAFRLEPLTRKGILTVDGERVEYGPIQGQVHRGLARLITGGDRLKIATG
ncbi:sphingosine kinase 2 [Chelonoidis abingdonii]|uniref:sphingosine kinase 2 n=1 Tax=Chelonoidis abingdonii TaxID=106734 RepID=UPI003F492897